MSQVLYKEISECRICRGTKLDTLLDLGFQALGGRFPREGEADPEAAPLVLVRCCDCGLVQLRHSVSPGELYTYGYGYRSGTNATMRAHLAALSQWVQERCPLNAGDLVVDIGCNDGTLLKSYSIPGLQRVGIDAIAGKFRDQYPPDIRLHEGFFSKSDYVVACGDVKAKAITSISMFYDLEEPNEFVGAIKAALAVDGVWVLEQSYLPTMLESNAYDTICHEHLEYYALHQIEWLAKAHGLRVFDVELNACNGGSFRLAVCHENAPHYDRAGRVQAMRDREIELKLNTPAPYEAFKGRIEGLRDALMSFVSQERAAGKTFYLYGASTKGNTLLQYCGLDARTVVAAAERNVEKFGCRTPGSGIPIISEEQARAAKPNYFVVLPWHFRDEFLAREAEFRKAGGKLVFPLPQVEVL